MIDEWGARHHKRDVVDLRRRELVEARSQVSPERSIVVYERIVDEVHIEREIEFLVGRLSDA